MSKGKTSSAFSQLILGIAFMSIFIIFTRTPADADMWWHLRSGEEMVTQRILLLEDIFSFTRYSSPWVNAFWLSDIFIYLIYKAASFFGIAIFVALMGVATFNIVHRQMAGHPFLRALLLILAAITASPIWTPRPQLFSFFLLALLDYWLYLMKKERGPKLWLLVPFFALWANLHGGYIWGVLLLIATLVGEVLNYWFGDDAEKMNFLSKAVLKQLALYAVFALFAVLLNPNGFELWRLPFHTVDVSLAIQEWQSPDFHQLSFHPMLWMLFLFIAALAISLKSVDYGDLLKVLGFVYLAFVSQRNVAPFAIILLPILGRHLSLVWGHWLSSPFGKTIERWRAKSTSRQLPLFLTRSVNTLLVLLIMLVAFANLYTVTRPAKIDATYPTEAIQWIKVNRPAGHLFNSYNWGGYLIWALRDYPVFIDGRADLYGDEIIGEWWAIMAGGEMAQELLDEWGVNLILVEANWQGVNGLSEYGWELLYQDEMSVIYGR